jgi:tripartite-type tricarboxylate transporter receptor subunit TctC
MTRIALGLAALASLALALTGPAAQAQTNWPTRPVQFIVPLAPGGTADGVARVVAEKLSTMWPQRVYVENKPGGNTIPGTDAIAKAAPDGHTIGMGIITSMAANPFLFPKLPHNVEKDFAPLSLLATSPLFLIVHPSVPAGNLKEFIAYAKANPDKLSFASTGHGSSFHLATESFMQQAGIRMVHVPYKGMGQGMTDLLAGNVQVVIDISTMAQVRAGKLKALGVVSPKRFFGEPQVPSFGEQGIPDFEFTTWLTLHAPAGIPADVQKRIAADVDKVLQMPDVKERLLKMNYVAVGGTPDDLSKFLASERAKIGEIIKKGGIKVAQ